MAVAARRENDADVLAFLGELGRRARSAAPAPRPRSVSLQRRERGTQLEAAYDAAMTTETNKGYWSRADLLSSDAANSPEVRRTLRSRSRYECLEANPFAQGIVKTLSTEVIGRGPTLQCGLSEESLNTTIEVIWSTWAKRVHLARKLRTARKAKFVDGEVFLRLVTNHRLPGPIKLDVEVIEADRVANMLGQILGHDVRQWALDNGYDPDRLTDVDGVIIDGEGNPACYRVLKYHPGSDEIGSWSGETEIVPAEQMIHLFRRDRPGQHRGVPESTPSLPLFILWRDYTLAVVQNARTVAKHTVMMKTQAGSVSEEDGGAYPVDPYDAIDVDYDMATFMPRGWEPYQLRADQPASTFEMFRDCIWGEIARCADMPFNVAAGDSSKYNYASGRLDYQIWDNTIDVDRSEIDEDCLDVLFEAVLDEAALVGLLPPIPIPGDGVPHAWHWPHREPVDVVSESTAERNRLSNGTQNRKRALKTRGIDLEEHDRDAAASFGMSVGEYRRAVARYVFNLQQPQDAGAAPVTENEDAEAKEHLAV